MKLVASRRKHVKKTPFQKRSGGISEKKKRKKNNKKKKNKKKSPRRNLIFFSFFFFCVFSSSSSPFPPPISKSLLQNTQKQTKNNMTNNTPVDHSRVAGAFCRGFYEAFNKNPEKLHKFYSENASYTYGWEGNVEDERFAGREVGVFFCFWIIVLFCFCFSSFFFLFFFFSSESQYFTPPWVPPLYFSLFFSFILSLSVSSPLLLFYSFLSPSPSKPSSLPPNLEASEF